MTELNNEVIPRIVHYCWFGPSRMERIHKQCIRSWKRHLSEFTFMKWDESNIDITQHPFLETAYKMEKWAFVSDFVRLQKLYEYGGIYLDTDMLLLKPLNKFLLLESFFGAENSYFINCAIMGARKNSHFIQSCLVQYDEVKIKNETIFSEISIPQLITSTFRKEFSYADDFTRVVKFPGITVLPSVYFYNLPYKMRHSQNKKKFITDQSYALHLWDESWKDLRIIQYLKKGKYLVGLKLLFQKASEELPYNYFKRIMGTFIKSRF